MVLIEIMDFVAKKNQFILIIYIIDGVSTKMQQNNAFTVAKRTLEGQDMVYQSIKFTNNVWALAELKIQPGNPSITVSIHIIIKDFMEHYL